MESDRFYFRQLLSGRDFALDNPLAQQMVNFVYLIGDRETGEAVAVDPAYGVAELLEILGEDDMRLTGVLATHYHPDHVGGDMMGHSIEGVRELLELQGVKIHVHAEEADLVKKVTSVSDSDLEVHASGDTVMVGDVARPDLAQAGAPDGATFARGDARALGFDTEFDAAISLCQGGFGLAAMPGGPVPSLDPDGEVLSGMARAVVPGGRVAVNVDSDAPAVPGTGVVRHEPHQRDQA